MAKFKYDNNVGDYLKIRFYCDECGEENLIDCMETPNEIGEHIQYKQVCPKCGKTFNVDLTYNDKSDGIGVIHELSKKKYVDCINVHYEYCNDMSSSFFLFFDGKNIIKTSLKVIDTLPKEVKEYMYRLIYVNMFSLLEGYVKKRIKNIFSSSSSDFKVMKNKVYLSESLKELCGKTVIEEDNFLTYAYREKRCKIVHENAVLPYGDSVIVTKKDLSTLIDHVYSFAKKVDVVLSKIELDKR